MEKFEQGEDVLLLRPIDERAGLLDWAAAILLVIALGRHRLGGQLHRGSA